MGNILGNSCLPPFITDRRPVYIHPAYFYVIPLASGSTAKVALVYDYETHWDFACKSIYLDSSRSTLDNVRHEVQVMHHVSGHDNIVKVKDVLEEKDVVHIVMEICEGGDIKKRIKKKGYDEEEAKRIFRQLAKAISYCHELGVIHRDLKPENLMFLNRGNDAQLKVIDFGLSLFFEPGEKFHTYAGIGKYSAPELLSRQDYGQEVDIWSAGLILYLLLAGYYPHDKESEGDILEAIQNGEIDYSTNHPWPLISNDAKHLLSKMLLMDPTQRINAAEILRHPWVREDGDALDVTILTRMRQFQGMNKFKRVVLKVIAQELPQEEVTGLMNIFYSMDADKDGMLTVDELENGLRKWGGNIQNSEAELLMESIDLDSDGTIDVTEFIAATMPLQRIEGKKRLLKAFQKLEIEPRSIICSMLVDKYITRTEAEAALGQSTMEDKRMIDEIFEKYGTEEGTLRFNAFVTMMRSN